MEIPEIFQHLPGPWKIPEYNEKLNIDDTQADLIFKLMYGDMDVVSMVTPENYSTILESIGKIFAWNWNRAANIYILEYNPISNYEKHETETITPNTTETFTDTDRKEKTTTNVFGYNSTEPTQSDEISTEYTGGNTRTHTGVTTRQFDSTGDIGVQSPQSVIVQEIDLWSKYNGILNIIFEDLKKMLTIPIYDVNI